jgi:hypothetical protein
MRGSADKAVLHRQLSGTGGLAIWGEGLNP